MTQQDFGTINPNTKSGTDLATDLNEFRDTLYSQHSGTSAPSYIVTGLIWMDSTTSNLVAYQYDGSDSVPIYQLDATNNVARVALDADLDSYLDTSTDDEMKIVLGGSDVAKWTATGLQALLGNLDLFDTSGNTLLRLADEASAVNYAQITNAATGNAVDIAAVGSDTDIDIDLTPKGDGLVKVESTSALEVPLGTTAQQPAATTAGRIRWNTTESYLEVSDGSNWGAVGGGGLGVGQTRQDVSGSRSAGVWYTNNTGKPIYVSISISGNNANWDFLVSDDGGTTSTTIRSRGGDGNTGGLSEVILDGESYRLNTSDSLDGWVEIR